jgi:hypothetical protein
MSKFVYNTVTKCRVPYNKGLRVDSHPDLEWRTEGEEEAVPEKPQPAEHVDEMTVLEAIAKLDPEKDFTSAGLPNAKVLSELVGREVRANERDKEWATYQAAFSPEV